MAKGRLSIYATADLLNDFSKSLELSTSQLRFFLKKFRDDETFDFKTDAIEEFVEKYDFDINVLSSISSVFKFIHKYCIENSYSQEELEIELKSLAEKTSKKIPKTKLDILLKLFHVSESNLEEYSTSPYLNSVIPLLTTSTALFDMRAIFEDETDNIKAFKPVAIVRLVTIDDKDNKSNFRFQIELDGLIKTIEIFEGYRNRLMELNKVKEMIDK